MAQSSSLICNYCSYLLHFTIGQNRNNVQVILKCFQLHRGIKWEHYGHSYCLEWNNTNRNSTIGHAASGNAVNYLTNTQHCYLVLLQQHDHDSAICYLVRIELAQQPILVPIRNWSISKFQCDQNIQIAILNGPEICIINSTSIVVVSHDLNENNIKGIRQIPNPFMDLGQQHLVTSHNHSTLDTPQDLSITKIAQHTCRTSIQFTPYHCFGKSVNSQCSLYAVGLTKTCMTDQPQSTFKYKHCKLQSIALTPHDNNPVVNHDDHTIIPDIYCNILTCFTLIYDRHQMQAISKLYNNNDVTCNDAKCIILACTNQSQLVEICQTKLARLCKIPFNNAVDIACIMIQGINYIYISSADNRVCIINHQTQQIVKVTNNIKHILIDDFANLGYYQILLLQEDYPGINNFNETYFLIDVNNIVPKGPEESKIGHQNNTDNKSKCCNGELMAIKALDTRIKNLSGLLQQLRHKLKQKQDFAVKMLQLASQIGNRLPLSPIIDSTDLFTLIDGSKESVSKENEQLKANVNKVTMTVKHWKIIHDRLTIVFDIENKSDSSISSVVIILLSNDNGNRTTITSAISSIHQAKEIFDSTGIKKQRLSQEFNEIEDITIDCIKSGGKSRIIITTELPNLILTNYCEFDVLCAWKKGSINVLQQNSMISYGGTLRMITDDFISRSSLTQPFEVFSCSSAPETKIKDPTIELLIRLNEINPIDVIDNIMETLKSSQSLHEVTTALESNEQKISYPTTRTIFGSSGLYAILSTPDNMAINIKLQARNFRLLALTLRIVLSTLPDNARIEPKVLEIASLIQIIEAAINDMDNQINPSCCVQQYELNLPTNFNVNTTQLLSIDDNEFLAKYTNKTLRVCILLELIRLFHD